MSAKQSQGFCLEAGWRRTLALLLLALVLAGCAGNARKPPGAPEQAILAPAEQALAKARAAHADDFAPRTVDAARRRIATAREILFDAARRNHELSDTERERVQQLVAAAQLDARSALIQTQAGAVETKLAELKAALGESEPNATQTRGSAP